MLFFRIFKNDLKRNKGSMAVVFMFILLSSLLLSSGTRMILELNNALEALFTAAKIPHFVQMHSGDFDHEKLESWSDGNELIAERQIVEMITVDGAALFLKAGLESEKNSIMDISFVRQNSGFDFILDSRNRVIELSPGEIGLPIYYARQKNMGIGDVIRVKTEDGEIRFRVKAVIRDAQMNPAIVHSKRFLISSRDFDSMKEIFHETEYLIEYRLRDEDSLEQFTKDYLAAEMPKKGPTIDFRLFKTLNGLSDGIVAVIIIILSFFMMLIALLCLRFTIITAVEEDYREIGVMKAVGMPLDKIKLIYLLKYFGVGGSAAVSGFLISLYSNRLLTANSMIYQGEASGEPLTVILPVLSVVFIILFLMFSIILILKRFKHISAVQALQAGFKSEASCRFKQRRLKPGVFMNINIHLGIRDIFEGIRNYSLLVFIFFISAFITILPVNFLSTISSPDFTAYMGIGKSDIRIDLHQTETINERYEQMIQFVRHDKEIERVSPMVTSQFSMIEENGEIESLTVETGDFTIFPLDYLEGGPPRNSSEIAISHLNSRDLNKKTGDILFLAVEGKQKEMTVCGIYQDITNGGHTAKASIPFNRDQVLWYTLSLDMNPGVSIPEKVNEYAGLFAPARVTDLKTYLSQTLVDTISQVRKIAIIAITVGLSIAMLITSLFLRMMINRDKGQLAILRSLGFSLTQLRLQYLSKVLLLLLTGILAGSIFSNTAGQAIISFLISFMGAARIKLIVNPLLSTLLIPLLMSGVVILTTLLSIRGIKNYTIAASVAE